MTGHRQGHLHKTHWNWHYALLCWGMEGTLVLEKCPERAVTGLEMGWAKLLGLPYWRRAEKVALDLQCMVRNLDFISLMTCSQVGF